MKTMTYFIIILVQVFLLFDITYLKKTESLLLIKNDPSSVKFSEVNRKCKAECSKLSKVYPCFCDLSCIEYGDCCKLFAKACENYFEVLLNHNKGQKPNKNNTINETEFSSSANKSKAFGNSTQKYNSKHSNNTINAFDFDGKCCNDTIEPYNCFCDLQCIVNGDCCSDYNYCIKGNLLKENSMKISARKRQALDNELNNERINLRENYENNKMIYEDSNNISFKNLKKKLYQKIGIKSLNKSSHEIFIRNKTEHYDTKAVLGGNLGLYKVPTLTPQIGMKYISKVKGFDKNYTQLSIEGNMNNKNRSSVIYDYTLMKKAPVAANIYIKTIVNMLKK